MTTLILRWLKKKGIQIAIDDFGTGYSSLTYLKRFPIDTLKIDQAFIIDCLSNADNAALVSAINSLAKALNLRVIAEGVETDGQLDFLLNLHCEEMQGFYFSQPVPPAEFEQLLRDKKRLPLPPPA
jgi:EAL domain-containing protein (putative c-di-GMP-specific phosphodiesterase class I)